MSSFKKTVWRFVRPVAFVWGVYAVAGWLGSSLSSATVINVSPWQAGVRQDNFGGGLEPSDMAAGSHFELPGLSAVQAVDMRGRLTSFGGEAKHKGSRRTAHRAALDIRTVEGQTAQVDVAAAWHLAPGSAHELVASAMLSSLDVKIADKLESSLRLRLASLSSDDWFDAHGRSALADMLEGELATELAPLHVVLDGLYIQGVRFSKDFEKKLQEKQVSHQLALLHDARGRVEEALAEVGKLSNETAALEAQVLAEWDQEREVARAKFNLELATLSAETEAYVKGLKATVEGEYKASLAGGEEAIKLAMNESGRLRLEALSSEGGRIWLAKKAASNLDVREVWLDSRDPNVPSMLDLDALVNLLFGKARGDGEAMAAAR